MRVHFSIGRRTGSILLLLIVITSIGIYGVPISAGEEYYERHYEWAYTGHDGIEYKWTWDVSVPKWLYEAYRSVPLYNRTQYGPEGYGLLVTTNDGYMRSLAGRIQEASAEVGYGAYDMLSLALSFVQSVPYTADQVSAGYDEYPRFPIETLVDGGDCEDTSILYVTIVRLLGYDAVLLGFEKHMAVGVAGEPGIPGAYYLHEGRRYYYAETTATGWRIGQVPENLRGASAYIYIITGEQFVPHVALTTKTSRTTSSEARTWTRSSVALTTETSRTLNGARTYGWLLDLLGLLRALLYGLGPLIFFLLIALAALLVISKWSQRTSSNSAASILFAFLSFDFNCFWRATSVSHSLPHLHRGASSKSWRNLFTAAPARTSCFVVAAIYRIYVLLGRIGEKINSP